ncbi:hypothetical protein [Rubrolithibacter danxiaensis]|uniref:hypothetical protein n=1 Tax=Rubrolithibacter danxiaensis TaxID=3390805 RepID=UPI003BF7D6C9
MQNLEEILSGYDAVSKRSALYYLTRYVKQAAVFHEYEKDIFVEAHGSEPSDEIKALTIKLIEAVEKKAGKKAKDFSDEEFGNWMDTISDIEDGIDEEPSQEQIAKALSELDRFSIPTNKEQNDS